MRICLDGKIQAIEGVAISAYSAKLESEAQQSGVGRKDQFRQRGWCSTDDTVAQQRVISQTPAT
jgi:hypothetical protein